MKLLEWIDDARHRNLLLLPEHIYADLFEALVDVERIGIHVVVVVDAYFQSH